MVTKIMFFLFLLATDHHFVRSLGCRYQPPYLLKNLLKVKRKMTHKITLISCQNLPNEIFYESCLAQYRITNNTMKFIM